jgi:predicted sulfurtransferase
MESSGPAAGDCAGGAFSIVLFYKYTRIADPAGFISSLQAACGPTGLRLTGRVLVAEEGINGTLSSIDAKAVDAFTELLTASPFADFTEIDFKRSTADQQPFPSLLLKHVPVRVRSLCRMHVNTASYGDSVLPVAIAAHQEIISSGGKIPAPLEGSSVKCGVHLPPTEFHAALLAAKPEETVLIDVRCSKVLLLLQSHSDTD